ncbi:MAG TPA: DUF1045 domain-containing protein [Candidatus Saccharimonadales bacterium]|nr:DUF1045 domain-containing protein [Candidatus Saccharimonadales bacterium]
MTSISCDIVLLPSTDLAQKATTLSEQLSQFGGQFVLKDGEYFPHLSLYMAQLKNDDLGTIKEFLAKVATKTPAFELTANRYFQSHGYIDVEYQRTSALDYLQHMIITRINPFRDGLLDMDRMRLRTAVGSVKDNLESYGYASVGELFRPHMTFTRLNTREPIGTNDFPGLNYFNGAYTKLGLFELDSNNSCIRKIAEFKLTNGA